ncbi:hypothetical protein P280DRAFT_222457 [Massarina eburnea CBS 473.64]|uniref:Uncharacterized protein n=1 Tax=Massarina eburnea CBS 473.64 TaxID=1395130 RepID=A0A6A6S7X7_9PLEO|nr:hypothetical protein P280DRAFT_222457 [Massarina eburnea CBS 473.64]
MNGRGVFISVSAITVLSAIYIFHSPSTPSLNMSESKSTTAASGLEWKLSQISQNPPSMLVTLKNNSPSPFTLLKWGTPLDSHASNTGVFKVVDADTGEEINTDFIKVNRMMPPSREEVVTIAPGTEEATEVVFNKPWMPEKKPAKYKVKAEGAFTGIWDKYGDDVKENDLEAYTSSPFNGQKFTSNEAVMIVS